MTRGGRVTVNQDVDPPVVTVTGPGARSAISDLEQQFAQYSQQGDDSPRIK